LENANLRASAWSRKLAGADIVRIKITQLVLILVFAMPAMFATADEAEDAARLEQQQQEAFRVGFAAIVDGLNVGSFEMFVNAVDRDDFLNRVFELRLVDRGLKKDFIERAQTNFDGLLREGFSDSKEGVKATLLGVESRGDKGRAVVRFDLPGLQFSYHIYELRLDKKNRVIIVDWVDYLQGERFTEGLGISLVMASPSRPAVRKLIDFPKVKDADMFQFTEMLKAARDRQIERYIDIINGLNPEMQRQRVTVLTSVQLAKLSRNRRLLRQALVQMAKHFPDEPLFSLLLLDFYVPSKMYEEAVTGLQSTYETFGFDDAAMEARLSAITLVNGNSVDANAFAERAVPIEPQLELGWWSALRARVAVEDFSAAVEALQQLEEHHGHKLGAEQLQGDKSFAALLASDDFKTWAASR
jgi:tetratricopeptide (TPR) repeat protein